jgi:hypothetical protein
VASGVGSNPVLSCVVPESAGVTAGFNAREALSAAKDSRETGPDCVAADADGIVTGALTIPLFFDGEPEIVGLDSGVVLGFFAGFDRAALLVPTLSEVA